MQAINPLLLSTGALGSFTCSGMTLPALRGIRATGDTVSNVESQVFTPTNFGSSRDRTPDLLTTRPTCYHSATSPLLVKLEVNLIHVYLKSAGADVVLFIRPSKLGLIGCYKRLSSLMTILVTTGKYSEFEPHNGVVRKIMTLSVNVYIGLHTTTVTTGVMCSWAVVYNVR